MITEDEILKLTFSGSPEEFSEDLKDQVKEANKFFLKKIAETMEKQKPFLYVDSESYAMVANPVQALGIFLKIFKNTPPPLLAKSLRILKNHLKKNAEEEK